MKQCLSFTIIVAALTIAMTESISAQEQPKMSNIHAVRWLLGTWQMKAGKGTIVEKWQFVNDSTLQQHGFFVRNTDTIPQESIQLVSRNNELFYISTVIGQNSNQAVPFKIISLQQHEFIAENQKHDYPQRIIYVLKSPTEIAASIEGKKNGTFSKKEYTFVKLP